MDVELDGEIRFNEAEDAIESLTRGGSFEVEERVDGFRRRLLVEADRSGNLPYRYWVNRDEVAFDRGGQAWFAAFIPQLFRHTTIQSEERVARLMARGGTDAVLQEVGLIDALLEYSRMGFLVSGTIAHCC